MNITEESKGLEELLKNAEEQDVKNPATQCSIDNPECENCGS